LITSVEPQNFISEQHHCNLASKRELWDSLKKKKKKVTFEKIWNLIENMNVYIKGTSWAIELPS
jgi:hypothetical protein